MCEIDLKLYLEILLTFHATTNGLILEWIFLLLNNWYLYNYNATWTELLNNHLDHIQKKSVSFWEILKVSSIHPEYIVIKCLWKFIKYDRCIEKCCYSILWEMSVLSANICIGSKYQYTISKLILKAKWCEIN